MKKINLKCVKEHLTRDEMRTISGGDPYLEEALGGGGGGGGSVQCTCIRDSGTASGPASSCNACANYCTSNGYNEWWCFG